MCLLLIFHWKSKFQWINLHFWKTIFLKPIFHLSIHIHKNLLYQKRKDLFSAFQTHLLILFSINLHKGHFILKLRFLILSINHQSTYLHKMSHRCILIFHILLFYHQRTILDKCHIYNAFLRYLVLNHFAYRLNQRKKSHLHEILS